MYFYVHMIMSKDMVFYNGVHCYHTSTVNTHAARHFTNACIVAMRREQSSMHIS